MGRKESIAGALLDRFNPVAALCLFPLLLAIFLPACATLPEGKRILTEFQVLLKRGNGYYFNNRYEDAAVEYTLAIGVAPESDEGYRHRGYANLAMERIAAAERDFTRAVAINPAGTEAYLGRGALFFGEGRYADAIDDFDRALELDPWNASARYYKAVACEKIGRLREAVKAYEGYIHCPISKDKEKVRAAERKIEELGRMPLP